MYKIIFMSYNKYFYNMICNLYFIYYFNNELLFNLCCSSVAHSYRTLCDPMDCSIPGFSVLHCLPEFAKIPVRWVRDTIQPSHKKRQFGHTKTPGMRLPRDRTTWGPGGEEASASQAERLQGNRPGWHLHCGLPVSRTEHTWSPVV